MLNADGYLPVNETAIPYGEPKPVKGTPMDFSQPCKIGERIDDDFEQLHFGKGYDHNYVLKKASPNEYSYVGICESPKTGIKMEIYTTEPGLQLYTGNWMTGSFAEKHGKRSCRSAVVLKPSIFPTALIIRVIHPLF